MKPCLFCGVNKTGEPPFCSDTCARNWAYTMVRELKWCLDHNAWEDPFTMDIEGGNRCRGVDRHDADAECNWEEGVN